MTARDGDPAAIAAILRKRTEIVEAMFTQWNLRLIGFNYRVSREYALELICEVAAIDGTQLGAPPHQTGVRIKANLYDNSGKIFAVEDALITPEGFGGYDTLTIDFWDDNVALVADRTRIYAVSW